MSKPPDALVQAVVNATVGPLLLWACTSATVLQALAISGVVLAPAALMEGVRRYYVHKARTVHGCDPGARITIPPDVLACMRQPTIQEQRELIRRLRESQEQLIKFQRGE